MGRHKRHKHNLHIKCFSEAGVRFLLSVFFLLLEDVKTRKTFVAGGEERRNGCFRMVRPWLNSFRFFDKWRSYTCRFIELSPSDFDNILRLLLSVGFCRKSESLVKFIDRYHDLFFSCTSQAQVEIAMSRCFQDRILRRVTRISGPCCRLPPNPYFFWLRQVKLYYHANQI